MGRKLVKLSKGEKGGVMNEVEGGREGDTWRVVGEESEDDETTQDELRAQTVGIGWPSNGRRHAGQAAR